jgi:hypothetical protein
MTRPICGSRNAPGQPVCARPCKPSAKNSTGASRWVHPLVLPEDGPRTVREQSPKLRRYIRAYAKSAKPFRWTYTDSSRRIRPNVLAGIDYWSRRAL